MERSTSGMPHSFQSRAKTRSGPIRRIATGSISPAAWASRTAKLSQLRSPDRIKRSNCPLASKRSNGPGWRSLVGGPFCPRARYVRSGDNDRNRLACYEKTWLLFSSSASNHRSWTKATWKRILVKKLHYIFGVPAPGSPAKPLQDYIVLKEIAADCRRWVKERKTASETN